MFLVDTAEDVELPFLPKFYAEIDTVLTHGEHELNYKLQDKIIHLLFLIRINDKTEEYHSELQEYVIKTHRYFADLDQSKEK